MNDPDGQAAARASFARPRGHGDRLDTWEQLAVARANSEDAGLPHALVIHGPAGIGKYLFALRLGAILKCDRKGDVDGCGLSCPGCKQIAIGSHPDVSIVEREKASIGIDEVRLNVLPRLALRPTTPGPRVVIIRDAQALTIDAQNGLLKTLEEPAGDALLILVSDVLGGLLATVRSRCQTIAMSALPPGEVSAILEEAGFDQNHAERAAALSGGSVARALDLTADEIDRREDLIVAYERCRARKEGTDGIVQKLTATKGAGAPAEELGHIYRWCMTKVEASLGYTRRAESDRLEELLGGLDASATPRLIDEADRMHATISLLGRNANAKLAIRDLMIAVRNR